MPRTIAIAQQLLGEQHSGRLLLGAGLGHWYCVRVALQRLRIRCWCWWCTPRLIIMNCAICLGFASSPTRCRSVTEEVAGGICLYNDERAPALGTMHWCCCCGVSCMHVFRWHPPPSTACLCIGRDCNDMKKKRRTNERTNSGRRWGRRRHFINLATAWMNEWSANDGTWNNRWDLLPGKQWRKRCP